MAGIESWRGTIGAFRLRLGVFHDLPTPAGSAAHAGILEIFSDCTKIVRPGRPEAGTVHVKPTRISPSGGG